MVVRRATGAVNVLKCPGNQNHKHTHTHTQKTPRCSVWPWPRCTTCWVCGPTRSPCPRMRPGLQRCVPLRQGQLWGGWACSCGVPHHTPSVAGLPCSPHMRLDRGLALAMALILAKKKVFWTPSKIFLVVPLVGKLSLPLKDRMRRNFLHLFFLAWQI